MNYQFKAYKTMRGFIFKNLIRRFFVSVISITFLLVSVVAFVGCNETKNNDSSSISDVGGSPNTSSSTDTFSISAMTDFEKEEYVERQTKKRVGRLYDLQEVLVQFVDTRYTAEETSQSWYVVLKGRVTGYNIDGDYVRLQPYKVEVFLFENGDIEIISISKY